MSVVGVYVSPQGAVVAGDTKLSGNPNQTTIQKVFRKESILLGWTGNPEQVAYYLNPYFYEGWGMIPNENIDWNDPMTFFLFLDRQYYTMISRNLSFDVIFAAVVKFGNTYYAKAYDVTCAYGFYPEPKMIISNNDHKSEPIILGRKEHDTFMKNQTISSPNDFLNAFSAMLNEGVKFDETINNDMQYVYL